MLASLAPVVVLVMVYTVLHRTAALAAASAGVAERLLPEREALELVDACTTGYCLQACRVEAVLDGRRASLTLIIAPRGVLGLKPPSGGVSLGFEAARALGAGRGDTLTLESGDAEWRVRVEGVHRTGSALDAAAVARATPLPCRGWLLAPTRIGGGVYAAALARQASRALGEWSLLAIPALALASAVAAGKSRVDLAPAVEALEEQGVPGWLLAASVASLAALAAVSGYLYGVIASDALVAAAGSLAGAYTPQPPPTPGEAVSLALAPAAVASASALAGWALWRLLG